MGARFFLRVRFSYIETLRHQATGIRLPLLHPPLRHSGEGRNPVSLHRDTFGPAFDDVWSGHRGWLWLAGHPLQDLRARAATGCAVPGPLKHIHVTLTRRPSMASECPSTAHPVTSPTEQWRRWVSAQRVVRLLLADSRHVRRNICVRGIRATARGHLFADTHLHKCTERLGPVGASEDVAGQG